MISLIVPVYNNRDSLPRLLTELTSLGARLPDDLEVVFVVDGATDGSLRYLQERLPTFFGTSRLVTLSRNFGSFSAILAGLEHATGDAMVVMSADLQEPPELALEFHRLLASRDADVVFGVRTARAEPWWSRWPSESFWFLYRRFVVRDMPHGGVDVFGCSREVRGKLLELTEAHTNLIALVLWLGYRRAFVPYERRARLEGRSEWTVARKLRYAVDSVFSFTDLPIRALLLLGVLGTALSLAGSVAVFVRWAVGGIPVRGYTPVMLGIMFFGGLTALGFGITGQYLWLTLQNSRRRPNYVVTSSTTFAGQRRIVERNSS